MSRLRREESVGAVAGRCSPSAASTQPRSTPCAPSRRGWRRRAAGRIDRLCSSLRAHHHTLPQVTSGEGKHRQTDLVLTVSGATAVTFIGHVRLGASSPPASSSPSPSPVCSPAPTDFSPEHGRSASSRRSGLRSRCSATTVEIQSDRHQRASRSPTVPFCSSPNAATGLAPAWWPRLPRGAGLGRFVEAMRDESRERVSVGAAAPGARAMEGSACGLWWRLPTFAYTGGDRHSPGRVATRL